MWPAGRPLGWISLSRHDYVQSVVVSSNWQRQKLQKTEPWKDGGRENEEGGVKGQEGDWAGHYDDDDDDDDDANKCDADEHNCNLDHVLQNNFGCS